DAHAAVAVPARLPRLPVLLWRVSELREASGGAAGDLRGPEQLRQPLQRSDLLAGGLEHVSLHRGGHGSQARRWPRHGARDASELPPEGTDARAAAAALHRADRAEHGGVAMDLRPGHGPDQPAADVRGSRQTGTVLAWQS